MSEYTVDFTEAVVALEKGRCKRAKNKDGVSIFLDVEEDFLILTQHDKEQDYIHFIKLEPKHISDKWKLIGIKPRTEERTIKYWLIVWNNGRHGIYWTEPDREIYEKAQHVIPLSYPYTYIFPKED